MFQTSTVDTDLVRNTAAEVLEIARAPNFNAAPVGTEGVQVEVGFEAC